MASSKIVDSSREHGRPSKIRLILILATVGAGSAPVLARSPRDEPAPHRDIRDVLDWGSLPAPYRESQLVLNPNVRRELKMSRSQVDRWVQADLEAEKEALPLTARIDELFEYRKQKPPDRRDPVLMQALQDQAATAQAAYLQIKEDRLLNVLTPPQRDRLKQLQMQAQGHTAFRRPDIQQQLSLHEGTVRDLAGICKAGGAAIEAIQAADRVARRREPERLAALRDERIRKTRAQEGLIMKDVMGRLNEVQRATYLAMLGEPFDFAGPLREAEPAGEGRVASEKPR